MIKTCVFDADGKLINIGEWNNFNGENPLPEGVYSEEREVIYSEEHGWRLAGTPVPKSRLELLEESQLDLWDLILFGGEY